MFRYDRVGQRLTRHLDMQGWRVNRSLADWNVCHGAVKRAGVGIDAQVEFQNGHNLICSSPSPVVVCQGSSLAIPV